MKQSKKMALGGIFAALALVIMSMGGLIPVATFVCPMFCMMLLSVVIQLCGSRTGWAWYGAVALLSVLMGPDKEAAAVFVFLGYYPIVKARLDKTKLAIVWKLLLFNVAIFVMYFALIHLFGMGQIAAEYKELGTILSAVMMILGNVTFILLDIVLGRLKLNRKRGRKRSGP